MPERALAVKFHSCVFQYSIRDAAESAALRVPCTDTFNTLLEMRTSAPHAPNAAARAGCFQYSIRDARRSCRCRRRGPLWRLHLFQYSIRDARLRIKLVEQPFPIFIFQYSIRDATSRRGARRLWQLPFNTLLEMPRRSARLESFGASSTLSILY